ncbi:hypothetical protein V2647_03755 [Tenacibaculum maritimum]|uniref:hypothetical protein n=1 Tax=Tenacibaculum maritimum TaxID=107401 RepID=UPI00387781D3
MKLFKSLKITLDCSKCGRILLKSNTLIEVSKNFQINELSEKVKNLVRGEKCKKHPKSKVLTRYSFYHIEVLQMKYAESSANRVCEADIIQTHN